MAPKDDKRYKALQDSYAKATAYVIEQHRDEFNAKRQEVLKQAGIDWSPKPTEEEKAEAQLQALLAEHPGLAERVLAGQRPANPEPTNTVLDDLPPSLG